MDGIDPLIFVIIGFILVGALFAGVGIFTLRRGSRQKTWPTVQGVVKSASVVQGYQSRSDRRSGELTRYYPKIVYNYAVGGQTYDGDTLGAIRTNATSKGGAERAIAAYKEGGPITVHYDPADPANSAINPGSGGVRAIILIVVGALLLVLGVVLLSAVA